MANGYAEQYRRARRYLMRLTNLKNGIPHTVDSQVYEDDLYAFFQNCYHLKDWIKNDPTCAGWSDVESRITSDRCLSICADLCNASKHLLLTKPRSGENPTFAGGNIAVVITDGLGQNEKIEISIRFKVATTSGDLDAFDLANQCMQSWDSYLLSKGVSL